MPCHAAATVAGWSVRCAACGSCCNSAPMLSLAELFHHRHLFVGALGMRRIRCVRAGDRVGRGHAALRVGEEDRAACEQIAAECLHPLRGEDGHGYHLLLAPVAFDDPGLGRCPALGPDGGCSIHGKHKPILCSAVPFDPLMPDQLQHLVLADRWAESDDLGARCIARTPDQERSGALGGVVDDHVRQILVAGRRALAMDKRCWGDALFAELDRQALAEPGAAERIPTDGLLVIPLAPVLEWLAGVSERCRERCLDYLDAQVVLCELTTRACLERKQPSVGMSVVRLRAFLRAYHVVRTVLLARRFAPVVLSGVTASDVERWLETVSPVAPSRPGAGALA